MEEGADAGHLDFAIVQLQLAGDRLGVVGGPEAVAAAFLVPGALGAQEGGFLLVGTLLSLPAEGALALALTRRVRELAFGIPGILAWQWFEARGQWHHHSDRPALARENRSD